MNVFKWIWGHTEDNLAVLRLPRHYARVTHNGSGYNYEVMTRQQWNEYCLGRVPTLLAQGTCNTHEEARTQAERVLAQQA